MKYSTVGRRLIVKGGSKNERVHSKFEVTPDNISQILLITSIENLPKYKTEFQQFFHKGHIKNLGDCYINITSYSFNNLDKFDRIACLKLEVIPFSNRTRVYKILVNSKDLKYYYNIDYPDVDSSTNLLLITKFIKKITLNRQTLYSSLNIPISGHASLTCPKYSYALCTNVNTSIESAGIGVKIVFEKFLYPKLLESRIILQLAKKINGHYVVITVEHHKILKCWSLIIYFPKYCRRFVTSFYSSDLLCMKSQFVETLCPLATQKLESKKTQKDYGTFTAECLKQLIPNRNNNINKQEQENNENLLTKNEANRQYSSMVSNSDYELDASVRAQKSLNSFETQKIKNSAQREEVDIINKIDFYELKVTFFD